MVVTEYFTSNVCPFLSIPLPLLVIFRMNFYASTHSLPSQNQLIHHSLRLYCRSCNVRGQGVEYFLPVSKSWLDIAEVALYNLHIQNQDVLLPFFLVFLILTPQHPLHHPGIKPSRNRRFFNFQTEIIDFVLPRWSILCHGVDRGRNWESNLKNALESAPNFFQCLPVHLTLQFPPILIHLQEIFTRYEGPPPSPRRSRVVGTRNDNLPCLFGSKKIIRRARCCWCHDKREESAGG